MDSMLGGGVAQGIPLWTGYCLHRFLLWEKGFEVLRTGPSGGRLSVPFPNALVLQVGSEPVPGLVPGLSKARQLPRGRERVTCILLSSASACDPCKGASLCADSV